jgi:hypothetical protein
LANITNRFRQKRLSLPEIVPLDNAVCRKEGYDWQVDELQLEEASVEDERRKEF